MPYREERDFGLQRLVGCDISHVMSNINKHLKKFCRKESGKEKHTLRIIKKKAMNKVNYFFSRKATF